MKISLCLMVWNEKNGCEVDVPLLPLEGFHEVYVVDGGSTDGTVEYFQSKDIPVYRQPVKSLNAAYHYAVELCSGDAIVVFFPKGTIDPKCVLDIAKALDAKTELVIASRNMVGAKNEEDDQFFKFRKWGVAFLSGFSSFLWRKNGVKITDILHGVKGFTKHSFKAMNISDIGVTVDLEMAVRAYKLDIGRIEIPVMENSRVDGDTHFKILPTAIHLGRFLWKEIWQRYFKKNMNEIMLKN